MGTKLYADLFDGSVDKESACNAGDTGEEASSILGSGISPGGGHVNRKSHRVWNHWATKRSTAPVTCSGHACFVASIVFDTLWPHGLQPTRLLCPWDSPGKNNGVGCHILLQGNLLTQELNPQLWSLLNWQVGSLPLVPAGKPFM